MGTKITESNRCAECRFSTEWSCGPAGYPACCHPDSGPRVVNLLSEMDTCPLED